MNSRIKELAKQAGFTEEDDGDLAVWDGWCAAGCTEELKKFAELIVRECAKVVSEKTGPRSALNVLEHFGFEE